jgi:ATP-dependent Clp protease protease subunit|tara:strand:+ start:158566 stop:159201 length:636 start_codon:yes stop_codon:yes gene_type:complete
LKRLGDVLSLFLFLVSLHSYSNTSIKIKNTMEKINKVQDWIDNKLLSERKVFLWGQVDDESAKHVVERLLYFDSLNQEEIKLYINSPGGYVTAGFSMYDTIKQIKSPVSTICTGLAASMGSILLSAGEKGKRYIQPNARVMIHQPSGGTRGPASDIEITAQEILKTKELSAQVLADNCGQKFEKVMKDFNRDHWMDAEESVAYGIVDKVLK